ncbi:MAG: OB-fold domain-containing protein [Novosphingobium sp.]|nr:OB-fold domain-containing protein [Novosphingobium sp.]
MNIPKIVSDFRAGLASDELLVQTCNACGKPNMWPRYACPHCQSENLGWTRSAGQGSLHSFCVLRQGAPEGFEDDIPYAIGVVKLDEGVQLAVRLQPEGTEDWSAYQCDDRVEFVGKDGARECAVFRKSSD